nr:hypothetical protein CFP56_68059 [Quercus suber]
MNEENSPRTASASSNAATNPTAKSSPRWRSVRPSGSWLWGSLASSSSSSSSPSTTSSLAPLDVSLDCRANMKDGSSR